MAIIEIYSFEFRNLELAILSVKCPFSYRRSFAAIFIVALLSHMVRAETIAAVQLQRGAAELRSEYEVLSTQFAHSTGVSRPHESATGSLLFTAPDQYSDTRAASQSANDERHQYAEALFALARRAADAGQLSFAFQWATEVLRENPDHADARRVLGYEQRRGTWLTAYGAKMFDTGKTWNPKSGWESIGDAKTSPSKKDSWAVRTDHFLVTSNLSLEAAIELAGRLECLHQIWKQLFAGFYLPEAEVKQLFAGQRAARKQPQPFRVFYHRDRDDYAAALIKRQPRIAETLGIYFDAQREAHFFAGADQDAGTLYHEAVHQLFQESRPAAKHVGSVANFWIIEGVATYFETLTEHNDANVGLYHTIGESSAGRLPAARKRLRDGYYVPLARLTRMGKTDVQQDAEIAKLYSQASGLTAFLLDADDGRYREPLVRYLEAVYAGRDDAQSLSELAGKSYDELDAQYHEYMQSLPEDVR